MTVVELVVNDVIKLKKPHPCGANEWRVAKLGMDVALVCIGCGRELKLMRSKPDESFHGFITRAPTPTPDTYSPFSILSSLLWYSPSPCDRLFRT